MNDDYSIEDGLNATQAKEMYNHIDRYHRACHAMQSGVMFEMNGGGHAHEPKHLRVGVNSSMVQNGTLVRLLIEKGLLTWPEWFKELADDMEREVREYEDRAGVRFR